MRALSLILPFAAKFGGGVDKCILLFFCLVTLLAFQSKPVLVAVQQVGVGKKERRNKKKEKKRKKKETTKKKKKKTKKERKK
jgi:hypothetical protein